MLKPLLILTTLFSLNYSFRILIYSPSISASHLISNGRIADTLADAGHEVVMFVPEYISDLATFNGTKKAKVIRMANISSRYDEDMEGSDAYMLEHSTLGIVERLSFEYTCSIMCNEIAKRKEELDLLRSYNFDVGFAEQIDLCGMGVLRYIGIKNILWISSTPIMDAVSYNLGIPAPVSFVPVIEENDNGDVMGFWDRFRNLYMYNVALLIHRFGTNWATDAFRQHVDPNFPNVREIAANSSLCFVNADEMFDLPRPIIHKTIYVGGLGIKEPKPLNKRFEDIMSKGKKGVIVMSLGSIAQFHALPVQAKLDLASVVAKIPDYHFLFKIAKGDIESPKYFTGLSNVDFAEWMPQADLLGHPRLKLFIMHGGLNGLTEAMLRAVPVVVVPIFADQFRNGRNVEKRHVGKVVMKHELNEKSLFDAIHTIINDDSYKQAALRMQKLMSSKPFSPAERLIKWTEFAAENGVLSELHIEGSRMNSIIYFNLDIFAYLFVIFGIVCYITFSLLRALCCSSKKRSRKQKKN